MMLLLLLLQLVSSLSLHHHPQLYPQGNLLSSPLQLLRDLVILLLLRWHLQLDPQGNLFNIYRDEQGQRTITPVGNISQMQRFKVRGCMCCRAGRVIFRYRAAFMLE
jgi:hypothetical protein